jgi:outer membrane scaffolding protein for murein synthesis (MipA/OmpV family)
MSEEQEGGTSVKSILIGLVSTITIAVGGFITNKLTGGDEEEKTEVAAPAPVINITNSNQQQQSAGKTVIVNQVTPAKADVQAKPQAKPVEPKKTETEKRKEEGLEW